MHFNCFPQKRAKSCPDLIVANEDYVMDSEMCISLFTKAWANMYTAVDQPTSTKDTTYFDALPTFVQDIPLQITIFSLIPWCSTA